MNTRQSVRLKLDNDQYKEIHIQDILANLRNLCWGLNEAHFDFNLIEQKLLQGISSNMSKEEFIKYQAETLAYLNLVHPDYALLAARVLVQDLHEQTFDDVEKYADNIYNFSEKGN